MTYGEKYLKDYGIEAVRDRIADLEDKVTRTILGTYRGNIDNLYQEINNLKKAIGEYRD